MTALDTSALSTRTQPAITQWLIVLALVVLYGPVYYALATGFWPLEQYAHGPLVAGVVLWLLWKQRTALYEAPTRRDTITGSALLFVGLLLFTLGRSQEIINIEVASQIPVLIGLLLTVYGRHTLRAMWFPLVYLAFVIPLPSYIIDVLTGPLKQYVSVVVENLLYWSGYPIGRSGVVLTMGQYQILIADACSGLNSIYTLSAVGLLYSYISGKVHPAHTTLLLASILPIAFAANVLRVIVLMLITYYLGNEAGQGFFHGFAGMFLFVVALLGFIALDMLLRLVFSRRKKST